MAGSTLVLITLLAAAMPAAPQAPAPLLFEPSSSCIACHNQVRTADGAEVPIASGWRGSMMANAARDPYWQAAVRREITEHPEAAAAIEHECAACHMPMVRFPAHRAGQQTSVFASTALPMAIDGVSCSVCHQIGAANLGTRKSFNGGFEIDMPLRAGGPFEVDPGRTQVMQSASGFTPVQRPHLKESEVCATCHTLHTHALTKAGNPAGELPEQTPYLEWKHSAFATERSCQSCHLPELSGDAAVTSVLPQNRQAVSIHEFRGGNAFMMRILRTNAATLGVTAPPAEMLAAETRSLAFSQEHAARVSIADTAVREGRLQFAVQVTNLAGHKLPTAYPSRRVWLHVSVRDARGTTLFESGAVRPDGSIAGNDNDADARRFEPHYATVTSADQVQVYETIMVDSEGLLTTGLISAVQYVKDNRILPRGFDKATAEADVAVYGGAADDRDFLAETDRVIYDVPLGQDGPLTIEAEVLYQPIGFRWADTLGSLQTAESARFAAMYQAQAATATTVLAKKTVTIGERIAAMRE